MDKGNSDKKNAPELHGVFRRRDILVFGLLLVALILSWGSNALHYELTPTWYHTLDSPSGESTLKSFPSGCLPPIITDLNGDGSNEVILVTPSDLTLKVLYTNEQKSHVFQPEETASVTLSQATLLKGKRPMAVKTGYIERYNTKANRRQVIVVVLEDFTVLCYDNNLSLLWEKAIAHNSHAIDKFIDKFSMKELSILISPLSLTNTSIGSVFVGSSMQLAKAFEIHLEQGIDMKEDGRKEHEEMEVMSKMKHFSIYALDARNGHVVWRHDGMDVRPEQFFRSLPQNAFKIDMSDLITQSHHSASLAHSKSWSTFRKSLTEQLPHSWSGIEDTSFSIAHFEKKHIGAGVVSSLNKKPPIYDLKSRSKPTSGSKHKRKIGDLIVGKSKRFSGLEYPPLDQNAELSHDVLEHIQFPNVLVSHTSSGLEVVSLASGIPISSLPLPSGRYHTDLNGDSIIDSIVLMETAADVEAHSFDYANHISRFKHCSLLVISGVPAKGQLFNGTLCQRHNSLHDPLSMHSEHHVKLPERVSMAGPVVLHAIDEKTGLESKYKNIIVAVNNGLITCYRGDGEFQWQTNEGPTWDVEFTNSYALAYDIDAERVDESGVHSSPGAHVLVVGESLISVISRDGELLTSTELPAAAKGRPILGDFDSDGVVDVVIVTEDAVLGYRLEVRAGEKYSFIACVIISVVVVLAFLSGIRKEIISSGTSKKGVMSIIRSTDSLHID